VHLRRAAVPIGLAAALAYVSCERRRPLELAEQIAPRATEALDVADAPATIEELRRGIAKVLEREGVHGAAIALVDRNGPIWVGGVGVRDGETRAPVDGDTVFRIGSLTKSFVALGVMRLVDQGKLALDRPLRELLDVGIDNPWEAVAPVTLAQCMEHTAGLDEVRFNEVFTDDEDLPVSAALSLNARSRRIRWEPGTRHAYSNVGYTLAGRAIELATGEPFDAYLRREVLRPLGMRDADFRRTEAISANLATGYLDRGRPTPFQLFAHRPSGALLASAADLAKVVHFWIRRGEGYPSIVSEAGLARIERSGTLPYPHLDADYGFANYGDVSHPVMSRGHDGGMPGFHSSVRYFPELGVGYVLLLNSNYIFRGYFEMRKLLYAYLTRDRAVPRPAPVVDAEPERPGADYFAFASPRNALFDFMERVRVGWTATEVPAGVRLDMLQGDSQLLVPAHDGGYRRTWESGSSMRFTTNRHGVPVMVAGFYYAEAAPRRHAQARYLASSLAFGLINFAPLWAAIALALDVLRRRRVVAPGLVLWPAVAGLSCVAMGPALEACFYHGVIGVVHPLTVGLCALTLLFGVASAAAVVSALRWSVRPDRPRLRSRIVPTACAIAAFGIALWFAANGLIGLRTWSY
jgi:CubicO group peptidase (beta-lactamase class C family)